MSWTRLASLSLLGLALVYGAVYGAALIRTARAEATYPPAGAFVEVEGRRVHYVEMGGGPALVLIHGAFGSHRDFTYRIADRLADRYRVIAFDRPGLGYSDPIHPSAFANAAESPAEQARHLAGALRRLGVEDPIVLGHSFGGIVALAWALDHDPAAVVLVAGVALPWPGDLGWLYRVNGTVLGGGLVSPVLTGATPMARIEEGVRATFAPAPMPAGYADHIGAYMPIRLPVFRSNARQVNWLRPHVVAMEERYTSLDLPIEIVHGDADTTVPIAVHSGPLSERLDTVRLTVIEGAGHMPHHTHEDAVVAAVDRAATRAGLR
ncbi:MAG: alpha/beta hydrolase [Paracoccaceae bacterium]|nr:alpha/beta hydrolase [Paracoccaceae bacterium]